MTARPAPGGFHHATKRSPSAVVSVMSSKPRAPPPRPSSGTPRRDRARCAPSRRGEPRTPRRAPPRRRSGGPRRINSDDSSASALQDSPAGPTHAPDPSVRRLRRLRRGDTAHHATLCQPRPREAPLKTQDRAVCRLSDEAPSSNPRAARREIPDRDRDEDDQQNDPPPVGQTSGGGGRRGCGTTRGRRLGQDRRHSEEQVADDDRTMGCASLPPRWTREWTICGPSPLAPRSTRCAPEAFQAQVGAAPYRGCQVMLLRISSTIFLASPNSIIVLSRKNSSFSTPA